MLALDEGRLDSGRPSKRTYENFVKMESYSRQLVRLRYVKTNSKVCLMVMRV